MAFLKVTHQFKLYKPRNGGGGCASSWDFSTKHQCVFVEMAKQNTTNDDNGNATFDWKSPIRVKLGVSDIGEIMSVLEKRQNGVGVLSNTHSKHKGLFHRNDKGNAVLSFETGQTTGYNLRISSKKNDDKDPVVFSHSITNGEACVLLSLLRAAVVSIYKWNITTQEH